MRTRALGTHVLLVVVLWSAKTRAQPVPPAPHEDTSFDFMNELSGRGLHDLNDERWNLYGQFTYITSYKPPINAPYTNVNGSPNSLWPQAERGFTSTSDAFFG